MEAFLTRRWFLQLCMLPLLYYVKFKTKFLVSFPHDHLYYTLVLGGRLELQYYCNNYSVDRD